MHFNVDVMTAVLRFKFTEMCNSFQHMYRILIKRFWINRTDLDFIQNKLYKDLCLKITHLEFGTQINIYNNSVSWKNAVEIGLTNKESVTDSGKVINQWSLLANNTAPITPPNHSREPIRRVKLMSSRVLSDAVMEPDRFPLRKSFSVYKTQTVIVKYCNKKTLAIISLNSVIFFKRSCIFLI